MMNEYSLAKLQLYLKYLSYLCYRKNKYHIFNYYQNNEEK